MVRWLAPVLLVLGVSTIARADADWLAPGWEVMHLLEAGPVAGFAQNPERYLFAGSHGAIARIGNADWNYVGVVDTTALGLILATTSDGTLWAAPGRGSLRLTRDGSGAMEVAEPAAAGVVAIHGQERRTFGEQHGLPSANVWTLHVSPAGTLWAGTEKGVAQWNGTRFVALSAPELSSTHVLAMTSARNGVLWVGGTRSLARVADGIAESVLDGPAILSLAVEESGGVWLGTARGLRFLSVGRTAEPIEGAAEWLSSEAITALLRDRSGRLWAGTNRGVAVVDAVSRRLVQTLSVENGLPDARVLALFEDAEGAVWVGTRAGGATRLRPRRVWNAGLREGLAGTTATSVLRLPGGAMLVGTDRGVSRSTEGQWTTIVTSAALGGAEPRAMALAADGAAWIALNDGGLLRLLDDRITRVAPPGGTDRLVARSLFFDRAGRLWIGWSDGSVVRYEVRGDGSLDQPQTYRHGDGLCRAPATAVFEARDGALWLGTEGGGAAVIRGASARCLTVEDGLSSNTVTSFAEGPTGVVWIGTRPDSGLTRWKEGRLSRVGGEAGLYLDSVADLVDDGKGGLWMICGGGVARVSFAELDAWADGRDKLVAPVNFDTSNGMRAQEATFGARPLGARDEQGRLWVATLQGISVLADPTRERLPPAPKPVVESLSFDGSWEPAQSWNVTRREHPTVAFRFLSPLVEPPRGQVRFRYRFAGLDPQWRWTYDPIVRFSRLDDGEYRLDVQATAGGGVWHPETANVTLVVRRPFHKTAGFFALIAGTALLLALTVHRARLNALRARHAAVADVRQRIARDLHDVIGQSFASVGLMLDSIRGAKPAPDVLAIAEHARQVLDYCNEQIRRTIWELRQSTEDALPLARAIERTVAAMRPAAESAGLRVSTDLRGAPAELPADLAHEVPFVVAEALTNVVRHARAGHVDVTIHHGPDGLALTVEDDGVGPGPALTKAPSELASHGHFGVAGMRERARRLGGDLRIVARAGGGTVLTLQIPPSRAREVAS